jgi:hypothetical protein
VRFFAFLLPYFCELLNNTVKIKLMIKGNGIFDCYSVKFSVRYKFMLI